MKIDVFILKKLNFKISRAIYQILRININLSDIRFQLMQKGVFYGT